MRINFELFLHPAIVVFGQSHLHLQQAAGFNSPYSNFLGMGASSYSSKHSTSGDWPQARS